MGISSAPKTAFLLILCALFALPAVIPPPAAVPSAFALTAEEQRKKEEEEKKKKAEEEAKRKIKAFEDALRSGDQAKIQAAARTLDADPVAVRQMKSRGGSTHQRYTSAMKQAQTERISRETQARLQYEKEATMRTKSGESFQSVRSGMSATEPGGSMSRDASSAAMTGSSSRAMGSSESAMTGSSSSAMTGSSGSTMTGSSSRSMAGSSGSAMTGSSSGAMTGSSGSAMAGSSGSTMTGSSSGTQGTGDRRADEARQIAAEEERRRQAVDRSNAAAAAAARQAAVPASPPPPPPSSAPPPPPPAKVTAAAPTSLRHEAPPPASAQAWEKTTTGSVAASQAPAEVQMSLPSRTAAPAASPAPPDGRLSNIPEPGAPANFKARQQAYHEAGRIGQSKVDKFAAAPPEQINRAAVEIQSDQAAVQKMNQAPPEVKKKMADWQQRTQGRALQGAEGDLKKVYGPDTKMKTFSNPRTEVHVGDDLDAAAYSKGKDIPHQATQEALNKNYHAAVGGKKVVGDMTPAELAAKHRIVATDKLHPEAYLSHSGEASAYLKNPRINVSDPNQVANTIGLKGNEEFNAAARQRAQGNLPAAEVKEADAYRQASKQFTRQTAPRVEAQPGGRVPAHVKNVADITDRVGKMHEGKVYTPADAERDLAKIGETPKSGTRKMAELSEAAQVLKPPGQNTVPDAQINKQFVERVKGRMATNRMESAAGVTSKTPYQEPSAAARQKIADHRASPQGPVKKQTSLTKGKSSFAEPGSLPRDAEVLAGRTLAAGIGISHVAGAAGNKAMDKVEESVRNQRELTVSDGGEVLLEAGKTAAPLLHPVGMQVAASHAVGTTSYDVANKKGTEVWLDYEKKKYEREKALAAKEKAGTLTTSDTAGHYVETGVDMATGVSESVGYVDPFQAASRMAQGKDTWVGDFSSTVGQKGKEVFVDSMRPIVKEELERMEADAKAAGKDRPDMVDGAKAWGSMIGRYTGQFTGGNAIGNAVARAEVAGDLNRDAQNRQALSGKMEENLQNRKANIGRIIGDLERLNELDPNDPAVIAQKQALSDQYRGEVDGLNRLHDVASGQLGQSKNSSDAEAGLLTTIGKEKDYLVTPETFDDYAGLTPKGGQPAQDPAGPGEKDADKMKEGFSGAVVPGEVPMGTETARDAGTDADHTPGKMVDPEGTSGDGGERIDPFAGPFVPGPGEGETEIAVADGDTDISNIPELIEDPEFIFGGEPGENPGEVAVPGPDPRTGTTSGGVMTPEDFARRQDGGESEPPDGGTPAGGQPPSRDDDGTWSDAETHLDGLLGAGLGAAQDRQDREEGQLPGKENDPETQRAGPADHATNPFSRDARPTLDGEKTVEQMIALGQGQAQINEDQARDERTDLLVDLLEEQPPSPDDGRRIEIDLDGTVKDNSRLPTDGEQTVEDMVNIGIGFNRSGEGERDSRAPTPEEARDANTDFLVDNLRDQPPGNPNLDGEKVVEAWVQGGLIPAQTQANQEDENRDANTELLVSLLEEEDPSPPGGGEGGQSGGNIDDLRRAENGGDGYQPGGDVDVTIASNMNVSGDQLDRQGQIFDEWSSDAQATSNIRGQERVDAATADHGEKMDDLLDQGAETAYNVARQATQHDSASASQATLNKQKAETGQRVENIAKASFGSFVSELGNNLGRNLADEATGKDVARVDPTVGDGDGSGGAPPQIEDPALTDETVSKPPTRSVKKDKRKDSGNTKKGSSGNKNRSSSSNNKRRGKNDGVSISVTGGGRNRSNVKFFHGDKNRKNNKQGKPPKKPRCTHKPGGCPGKSPGDICYCGC